MSSEALRPVQSYSPVNEKTLEAEVNLERVITSSSNFVYNDNNEEPEVHARTYFALSAMLVLNLVQVVALQSPPAVVRNNRGTNYTARSD